MNTPRISVILPVYKVEKYINKCLDTLINQTLKEIEIILIDDCGGDNSIKIAEDYAKKDDRIIIIYNERNIGTGFSRNAGIKIAKGEYIGFVDPDDWIDLDYYEKLYQKANEDNSDIVKTICMKIHVDKNNKKEIRNQLNKRIEKGLKEKKPIFSLFTYEHWTAIYKKSIIIENNVGYPNIRNGQDCVFLLYVTYYAKTISLINSVYYYYRWHSSSVSQKKDVKILQSRVKEVTLMFDFINSNANFTEEDYQISFKMLFSKLFRDDIAFIFEKNNSLEYYRSEYLKEIFHLLANFKYLDEKKIQSVIKILGKEKRTKEYYIKKIKKIPKYSVFIISKLRNKIKKQ